MADPPRLVLYLGDRPLARRIRDWLLADPARGQVVGTLWVDEKLPAEAEGWQADLGVCCQFRRILRKPELDCYPRGIVNLHTGYLPWNRGAMPNVWPIIDGTPAGVTLHYLDEGVDTGPIITARQVKVESWDTGESLYHRLEGAAFDLFTAEWPTCLDRSAIPQTYLVTGSTHRSRDVETFDWLKPSDVMTVFEMLDLLRSRTFTGYRGCYVIRGGRRVYVRVSLEPGELEEGE